MELKFSEDRRGITANFKGKPFKLVYPEEIWANFANKPFLTDNLAHLLTINMPLIAGENKLKYNTSLPLFKLFFDKVVIKSIPHCVDDYPIKTGDTIKQFLNIKYEFSDTNVKKPIYGNEKFDEKAIVSFSCGKDSQLSLAVAEEAGLKPTAIYINDTVSPTENKAKIAIIDKLKKETGIKFHVLTNEIENLNDFEFWKKPESCLSYSHMVTGFCFIALPFSYYYKAKHIIIGNQQDMNFLFVNKDGYLTSPSYDQTEEWMKWQNMMIKIATNSKTDIVSLIEPLTNIAIIKILHGRYKNIAKYQFSCDCLDLSKEKRWCINCNKCARLGLFMLANNFDLKTIELPKMLDKKHQQFYTLFDGKGADSYEKSIEAKEQQLLAFYMAYRNNVKGDLIDEFKKRFLQEAKAKEDYLYNKFFKIYKSTTMPAGLNRKVMSIYKEELNN